MSNGWIKLHRKLLQWEHFKEPNVLVVFMALLLSSDKKTGVTDLSITDLEKLTGLSRKTVIKAIKSLNTSGEITREILKNGAITGINNFSKYQIRLPKSSGGINTPSGVNDTPLPPYNNKQEDNKNNDDARARTRERLRQEIMVDANIEIACMTYRITADQYKELADVIFAEWTFADLIESEWTKMHFLAVLRYKVKDLKRENNGNNSQRTTPVAGRLPGQTQTKDPLVGYKKVIKA